VPIVAVHETFPSHGNHRRSRVNMSWASEGWSPSGSPVGHWSADTITGLEDGDPVGTWPDQSGNGYDLTQATAANKPLYKVNIQNGLAGILFDRSDDKLALGDCGTNYSNEHTTLHAVFKPDGTAGYGSFFGMATTANESCSAYICYQFYSGSGTRTLRMYFSGDYHYNPYDNAADTLSQIWTIRRNGTGSNVTVRHNAVNIDDWLSGSDDYPDIASADSFEIGRSGSSSEFGGHIHELIFYNIALADVDRDSNETGLNTKWGIW